MRIQFFILGFKGLTFQNDLNSPSLACLSQSFSRNATLFLQRENLQRLRKTIIWGKNIHFYACRKIMKIPEPRCRLTEISFNNQS